MERLSDLMADPAWSDEEIIEAVEAMFRDSGLELRIDGHPGFWHGRFFRCNESEPFGGRVFFSGVSDREEARSDIFQRAIQILEDIFLGEAPRVAASLTRH